MDSRSDVARLPEPCTHHQGRPRTPRASARANALKHLPPDPKERTMMDEKTSRVTPKRATLERGISVRARGQTGRTQAHRVLTRGATEARAMFLICALTCACGGRSRGSPGGESSGAGSAIEDASAGAAVDDASGPNTSGGNPGPLPPCSPEGARRAATAGEMAQYCLCTSIGEDLAWECYGPPPTGAPPATTCTYSTEDPGTGQGSCYSSWEKCSDNKVYAISCVDSHCQCLVQGVPSAQLAPMQICPAQKADFNLLCGWNLQ